MLARTWNRLHKALSNGREREREREWHNRPFSTLASCATTLRIRSGSNLALGYGKCLTPLASAAGRNLDLRPGSRQTKEQQAHALRMQFRREAFGRYTHRKAFLEMDIPRTRLALSFSPAHRAVVLGSGVSPAFLQRAGKSGEDGSCPFCQSPDGHWRHIMWLCPQNRPHDSAPSNPFAKRLGWITWRWLQQCFGSHGHYCRPHVGEPTWP